VLSACRCLFIVESVLLPVGEHHDNEGKSKSSAHDDTNLGKQYPLVLVRVDGEEVLSRVSWQVPDARVHSALGSTCGAEATTGNYLRHSSKHFLV